MKKIICFVLTVGAFYLLYSQDQPAYLNTELSADQRAADLVSRLTLEEKVHQMLFNSPGIPRLNIPAYNWWNECLHGVARSGAATVFPQAIGLGATFDDTLLFRIATATSDEARAMYNAAIKKGFHSQYGGLTFWTPNINIFRDPRWGRGQETYGEDPFLTANLGSALVKGLQGNNPKYLKVAACAKHFVVHSGPEKLRHEFNAIASPKDLNETYLPAFEALVNSGVEAVMCAYNRTNDYPCCGNNYLIKDVLRKKWGFTGHVVTDCGALVDFYKGHNVVPGPVEAAAMALRTGVNLNCGNVFENLTEAARKGLIRESQIDSALVVLLKTKFKLGLFDPEGSVSYNSIKTDVINSDSHRKLAKEAALKSIVLLKNNGVLPLNNNLSSYFITGPYATSIDVLLGNYYGLNGNLVSILEGIASKIQPGSQIQYKPGFLPDRDNLNPIDWTTGEAKGSDVTIVTIGISGLMEGEEGESLASSTFGDRLDYNIPKNQIEFLKKVRKENNKPIIAIITGGSPMNLSEVHDLADAVLLVWYPGEEGGNAIADIIFGNASPSGKLPVTFPRSLDQLPPYEDYGMEGRTYKYMKTEPLYPFGFGLSYGHFEYSNIKITSPVIKSDQSAKVEVMISNTGKVSSEEVVQLYVTDMEASVRVPLYSLKAYKRISLKPGETIPVTFTITPEMLKLVNEEGEKMLEKGVFKIYVGGSLPVKRSQDLGVSEPEEILLTVK